MRTVAQKKRVLRPTQLKPRIAADQAMQWLSRTLAIILLMIAPGFAGRGLDRRIGTQFLTPMGFVLGTVMATVMLLILAQKMTQPASNSTGNSDKPPGPDREPANHTEQRSKTGDPEN